MMAYIPWMAKPIITLELYHPMIQFLKIIDLDNNN